MSISDGSKAVPITSVVLFSSGVGCFTRLGKVNGNASLELVFNAEQINDLLKSLVVMDLDGGQVSGVGYASQDPAGKALQAFGVNLSGNPSLGSVLGQLGGVPLGVTTADGECRGKVLGVEPRQRKTESGDVIEFLVLSLLTGDGIRSFPVDDLREIKVLDENLAGDIDKALAVLARSRDRQRRAVSIGLTGSGERRVKLAYLLETPVWKVSYRLVLDKKSFLQGWAMVDNTTDDDWKNIQLSLVSGRPISFIQDLYTPLYLSRPVVQPELYAGLRPVGHAESVAGECLEESADMNMKLSGTRSRTEKRGARPRSAPAMVCESIAPCEKTMSDSMEAAGAAAAGGAAGELFCYTIKLPVSIARQSAAPPIIAAGVEGEKLSVYNAANHPKHPYSSYKMKNSTGLTLMSGPVTIFDEDVYAGDAQVPTLHAGEERLISYGLDLACHVDAEVFGTTTEMISLAIAQGCLRVTQRESRRATYALKNKKDAAKAVVVEHPYDNSWELKSPGKFDERTDAQYRFRVDLKAGASAKLEVVTQRTSVSHMALTDLDESNFSYYVDGPVSAKVKKALQAILEIQKQIVKAEADRGTLEERKAELFEDQKRIRADLAAVPAGSKLRERYTKKLAEQEDRIDKLEDELEAAKTTERAKREELAAFLENLELE